MLCGRALRCAGARVRRRAGREGCACVQGTCPKERVAPQVEQVVKAAQRSACVSPFSVPLISEPVGLTKTRCDGLQAVGLADTLALTLTKHFPRTIEVEDCACVGCDPKYTHCSFLAPKCSESSPLLRNTSREFSKKLNPRQLSAVSQRRAQNQ